MIQIHGDLGRTLQVCSPEPDPVSGRRRKESEGSRSSGVDSDSFQGYNVFDCLLISVAHRPQIRVLIPRFWLFPWIPRLAGIDRGIAR